MTSRHSRNHTRPSGALPLHIHPLLKETDVSITLDHHTPHAFVDPYAADPAESAWPPAAGQDTDFLLPPPNPAERLSILIAPRDQRRLALHAALTAAGIPPRPEDRDAIDQLSALPSSINTTLQRWLNHTA
ncbi:hypothetical protein M2163_000994 [Streptomyces sp. SAI-135]|nr:hypothetical protein [Streptomyces sp. SAI-090]MDH6573380.1 hypothetical protein [Streptomyces sp. SAI-117]MDH6613886.1 hypothetical protein [Streptomyces sp. SAI-135]